MIAEQVLKAAVEQERGRHMRLAKAWRCYEGQFDKPLLPTKTDPLGKDNVLLNYAQVVVNKGVSFLMGQEVDFEIDGGNQEDVDTDPDEAGAAAPSEEAKWLDLVWAQNRKGCLFHNMAINGGVTGDVFVRLRIPEPASGQKYPRIENLDPANVTPILGTDDIDNVQGWVIQWNCMQNGTPAVRRQLIEPSGAQWTITDHISVGNQSSWTFMSSAIWPYPWAPVLHCNNLPQQNVFWGMSDIEAHVLSVNDAINKAASSMARILGVHAHPKTWGRGFSAATIDMSVDSLTVLPNPASELKNLEMASDLSASQVFLGSLVSAIFQITGVPELTAGNLEKIGQLSGLALKILYGSLLEKNATKQLFYGAMLEEMTGRLLEMGGFGDGHSVEIQWPDPLPQDSSGNVQDATVLDGLGVSKDTLLTRLGFDPAVERAKKAKEMEDAKEMGAAMLSAFEQGDLDGGDSSQGK